MYLEEMKEQELNGSEEKSCKSGEDPAMKNSTPREKRLTSEIESKHDVSKTQNNSIVSASPSTSPIGGNVKNQSGFSFIGSSELDGITQGSPKKARNHELASSINMDVKANEANNEQQLSMDERQSRDGYSFMGSQTNFTSGFGQYPMEEIGRFDAEQFTPRFSGNGVSLTLGLPHCDTLSGTHQTFLPNQNIQLGRGLDIGQPNQFGVLNNSTSHSSAAFESINMQNPKRFPAQLVLDFVA